MLLQTTPKKFKKSNKKERIIKEEPKEKLQDSRRVTSKDYLRK